MRRYNSSRSLLRTISRQNKSVRRSTTSECNRLRVQNRLTSTCRLNSGIVATQALVTPLVEIAILNRAVGPQLKFGLIIAVDDDGT